MYSKSDCNLPCGYEDIQHGQQQLLQTWKNCGRGGESLGVSMLQLKSHPRWNSPVCLSFLYVLEEWSRGYHITVRIKRISTRWSSTEATWGRHVNVCLLMRLAVLWAQHRKSWPWSWTGKSSKGYQSAIHDEVDDLRVDYWVGWKGEEAGGGWQKHYKDALKNSLRERGGFCPGGVMAWRGAAF